MVVKALQSSQEREQGRAAKEGSKEESSLVTM